MFAKFMLFSETVSSMLQFRSFKTHSLIQFTRSLSQFDMMALRNLAERFLIIEECGNLPFAFHCLYLHISRVVLLPVRCIFEN